MMSREGRVLPGSWRPALGFRDPMRLACLAASLLLVLAPEVPFALTLLSVAAVQTACVAMVMEGAAPGWSCRWGRGAREGVAASGLAMDFVRLLAAGAVGAALLARHFDGPGVPRSLGILAAVLCLVPDVPPLRGLLSGDPGERSRRIRRGWFFCDPASLAVLGAAAGICLLDARCLRYAVGSLVFLQTNALLVFLDKHLPEVEARRFPGWRGLLLEREGRRLAACLGALALVPARLSMGDRAGWMGAALLAAFVAGPGAVRAAGRILRRMARFPGPPAPVPSTIVILPRH